MIRSVVILFGPMIVGAAREGLAPSHDRMSVQLEAGDFGAWLDGMLGPEVLRPPAQASWCAAGFATAQPCGVGGRDPTISEPVASYV
jgi:hypothetical protein